NGTALKTQVADSQARGGTLARFAPLTQDTPNTSRREIVKIAVLGTGNVGGTLGKRWAQAGHQVLFGSRDPASEKVQKLIAETGHGARAVSPAEAAQASDVILLSTPWTHCEA